MLKCYSLMTVHIKSQHEAGMKCEFKVVIIEVFRFKFQITSWCRIFEKLIVAQLIKKYPAFFMDLKVHHHVHKSPPLDPILSQLNPVHPIDPYSSKV